MLSDNDAMRVPAECSAGSDILRARECMDAFLKDIEGRASMTPVEHLAWVTELPPCLDTVDLPVLLQDAVDFAAGMPDSELSKRRLEARAFWIERKRVLDSEWINMFRTLPEHVRSVLGPKKNLLLFREMLVASGSPDESLFECLTTGFPLVGKLPRSGTLPSIQYEGTLLMDDFMLCRLERNEEMMKRARASALADSELHSAFDAKAMEEMQTPQLMYQWGGVQV